MSIATLINALTVLIIGLAMEQPAFAQSSPGNPSSRSEAPAKQALPEGPFRDQRRRTLAELGCDTILDSVLDLPMTLAEAG